MSERIDEHDELRGEHDAAELARLARSLDVSDAPGPRAGFLESLAVRLEREVAERPRRRAFPRLGLSLAASIAAAVVLAVAAGAVFPAGPSPRIAAEQRIVLASANGFIAYDPATLQEKERVNVPANEPWAALAPDQRTLVFTFRQYGRVMRVLDIRDPSAYRNVDGLSNPWQFALSRDGRRAYVRDGDSIKIVDVAGARAVATIPTPGIEDSPVYLAPDGRRLFQFRPQGELVVFDVEAGREMGRVAIDLRDEQGLSASGRIAFSPDGTRLYAVGSTGSPTGPVRILVLDTATLATLADRRIDAAGAPRLSRGPGPSLLERALAAFVLVAEAKELGTVTQIALSPDGRVLYAARGAAGDGVLLVDTERLEAIGLADSSRAVYALQLSPDGARIYALAAPSGVLGSASLAALDARSYAVVATVPTRNTAADSAVLLFKP